MKVEQSLRDDDQRIRAVQHYIHAHITEALDRKTLAAVAGFSVSHFHRIFVESVGESPSAYVRRVRMKRAGRKLRMGAVDIGEVALAAGYETHTAFSKAFKQHFGLAPSDFRRLGCQAAGQLLKAKCHQKGELDENQAD